MSAKCLNPKWTQPGSHPGYEVKLTRYEKLLESGATPEEVVRWIRKNASRFYVPEDVLDAMGIVPQVYATPSENWGWGE